MTFSAGCGGGVDSDDTSSQSSVCSTAGTAAWWNSAIGDQSGRFHVEFSATPSAGNEDATVGLSNGAATTWSKLAAIVRFNPLGFIDARSGSEYKAVQQRRYSAGATYWIRVDIDVPNHVYSAWASDTQGQYDAANQIAANYPFRTEQAGVTKLNNVSAFVNPQTGPGTLQVCGLSVNAGIGASTSCIAANGGGSFTNYAVAPGVNTMIVDVSGKASIANVDAVIGVASGAVDAYNDFAASIRFYTNGNIEARDGDTYRSESPYPYSAGATYRFRFVIDIASKTYDVVVVDPIYNNAYVLAHDFHFRPEQSAVTRLDHVATVVASSSGHIDACEAESVGAPELVWAHQDYIFNLAPLANDGALSASGWTTRKVDSTGKLVGTLPVQGYAASDASGNLYIVRATEGYTVTVDSFTSTLSPRWTRTQPAPIAISTVGVAGNRLLIAGDDGQARRVYYVATDGSAMGLLHSGIPGTVAVGPLGYMITAPLSSGMQVSSYDNVGNVRWSRVFTGTIGIYGLAQAPDGSVVFGGEYVGETNFGDGMHYPEGTANSPENAYIVALDPRGALRFSRDVNGARVGSIATNGTLIAMAEEDLSKELWLSTEVYNMSGTLVHNWSDYAFGFTRHGQALHVYMSASGRVFVEAYAIPFYPQNQAAMAMVFSVTP